MLPMVVSAVIVAKLACILCIVPLSYCYICRYGIIHITVVNVQQSVIQDMANHGK